MKEIVVNGVTYVPASALAKQFRYTTDYIGQLCRAKKVDAQLIGRSWYVNPLSLTAHKKSRYTKPTVAVEETEGARAEEVAINRVEVPAVIARKTAKVVAAAPQHFAKRIEWKPLKYEVDEEDLLPKVKRVQEPKKVLVDLAEATDISIKSASKTTSMVADELPTVSLRGRIKVASIEESFDVEMDEESEIPLPPVPEPVSVPAEKTAEKRFVHNTLPSKEVVHRQKLQNRAALVSKPAPRAATASIVSPFTPRAVLEVDGSDDKLGIVRITLATTSGILALLLALVIFTENTLTADAVSYEWGMHFSTQSLTALVTLFAY